MVSSFSAYQFIISLYLVEYPFANGAFGRVSFSFNCLKFNGYDSLSLTISEPTRLATTSHGDLAFLMIKAEPTPGSSEFHVVPPDWRGEAGQPIVGWATRRSVSRRKGQRGGRFMAGGKRAIEGPKAPIS
jgi:hypothetical protein